MSGESARESATNHRINNQEDGTLYTCDNGFPAARPSMVLTASQSGLETELVIVETDLAQGLPALYLVGLPSLTVRESRERVRSAITHAGYRFPQKRITVNLSPADTKKEGSHFDLPMAVGILAVAEEIPPSALGGAAFLGELSLDGKISRTEIGLPLTLGLKEKGVHQVFLPSGNMRKLWRWRTWPSTP